MMNQFVSFMKNFQMLLQRDENLLRLLYYTANNMDDDVTIITTTRPRITPIYNGNIPSTPTDGTPCKSIPEYFDIVKTLIYSTIKITDITSGTFQGCRLLFYLGQRTITSNSRYQSQRMIVDLYVHTAIDGKDYRLAKLCDRLTELVDQNRVGGIGTAQALGGVPLTLGDQYIGYRLLFDIGSDRT
jgi:hypothetical protein